VTILLVSLLSVYDPQQQTFAQINESGGPVTTNNLTTRMNKDGNATGFISYDNPIFGISLEYPLGWSAVDIDFNQSEPYHRVVEFTHPLESSSDKYQENVVVAIDWYGDFGSLNEYLGNLINLYREGSSNFRVITNDTSSVFAGQPAYKFVFDDLDRNNVEIRGLEFGTMIDKIVYSFSYYAEKDKYNDYLPAVQKMIESFKIFDVGLESIQAQ
jgi:eukaryotic-like serine/threonine-protein kinase